MNIEQKAREVGGRSYLADLHRDLQDDEFLLEYLTACSKEGVLSKGIQDVLNSRCAAALQSAVAEEREKCAKLMEYNAGRTARWLAAAIRARGQKETA